MCTNVYELTSEINDYVFKYSQRDGKRIDIAVLAADRRMTCILGNVCSLLTIYGGVRLCRHYSPQSRKPKTLAPQSQVLFTLAIPL